MSLASAIFFILLVKFARVPRPAPASAEKKGLYVYLQDVTPGTLLIACVAEYTSGAAKV